MCIRLKRGGIHVVGLVGARGAHHPWKSVGTFRNLVVFVGGTRRVSCGLKVVVAAVLLYSFEFSLRKISKHFEKLSLHPTSLEVECTRVVEEGWWEA